MTSSKILWTILTLLSAIYGLWICGNNIGEYYKYDVISKIQKIHQKSDVLPTIVICPYYYSNKTLLVTSAIHKIRGTNHPITTLEFSAESGDCIRFNGNSNSLSTIEGVEFSNSLNFKIKFPEAFIVNIADNFIQTYYTSETYNLDPNKYYQFKIIKSVEIQLKEPYNPCSSVPDETYRQLNCQQMCVYERYATKHNCSFIAYHSFLSNNFSQNKCLDVGNKDRFKYKTDLYQIYQSAMVEFGSVCLEECPKECTTVKFKSELLARSNSSSFPIDETETLFSFYFETLDYDKASQIPKITLSALIANIGGALGVFIGVKFLSIVELIEYIVEVIGIFYFDCNIK